MSHDIDVIVDVANKLKYRDDINYIFIGNGAKKAIVENKIKKYNLTNCLVLPYQSQEILPYSMGAADISVVTTDVNQTGLSVPSKTYSYLSVGSALLCLADINSELANMVINNEIGGCFDSRKIDDIAIFIANLVDNPRLLNSYKSNSRKLSESFTPENAKKYLY